VTQIPMATITGANETNETISVSSGVAYTVSLTPSFDSGSTVSISVPSSQTVLLNTPPSQTVVVSESAGPTGGVSGPEPIPLNADFGFYFDQKVGYEDGTTAAFVLADSYNTYVSPHDLPVTFDVSGETKNITTVAAMSFFTRSFNPVNVNFPELGTYDEARSVRIPDLMAACDGYKGFSTVSVAGHSGLYVESIRTPFREGAQDIQVGPSYFNYVKELRNHELNACVAAIDLLASAGIDGGTF
jgi:hypothetical protein